MGKEAGMSDELKQQIAMLINNIIVLITFAVLAMFFKKWWLVLFTIIFSSYPRKKQ